MTCSSTAVVVGVDVAHQDAQAARRSHMWKAGMGTHSHMHEMQQTPQACMGLRR